MLPEREFRSHQDSVIGKLKLKGQTCHLKQGREAKQRNEREQERGWRGLESKTGFPEAIFIGLGLTMRYGDGWDEGPRSGRH